MVTNAKLFELEGKRASLEIKYKGKSRALQSRKKKKRAEEDPSLPGTGLHSRNISQIEEE